MTQPLILLHGLWMRGITLTLLQHRLEHAGFGVETFDYLSMAAPLEDTLGQLRERMHVHTDGVHLVGHSLGGLLALLACDGQSDLPPGRIVCLASPLTGSAVARQLAQHGAGWLMGRSREVLERGIDHWDDRREVGMVAGTAGVGLGAVVGHIEGDNDGTVAVCETRLPGLADHCVVPTSHTGMLFSRAASEQVVAFLRTGHFEPPAA